MTADRARRRHALYRPYLVVQGGAQRQLAIDDIAAVDREKICESNRARGVRIVYDAASGLNQIDRPVAASVMGVRWNRDAKARRQDR